MLGAAGFFLALRRDSWEWAATTMLGLFGGALWLWNVVGVSDAAVFAALWPAVGGEAAASAAGRPRGWRRNRGR